MDHPELTGHSARRSRSRFAPSNPAALYYVVISADDGVVHGAGFLLDDNLVCTCAHVICDALALHEDHAGLPFAPVKVAFPFLGTPAVEAKVVHWTAVEDGDVALLELPPSQVPSRARPARLLDAHRLAGRAFTTEGPHSGTAVGTFGEMRANDTVAMVPSAEGFRIVRGFSGAPVRDRDRDGVVGMVVRTDETAGVAELLPTYVFTRLIAIDLEQGLERFEGLPMIGVGVAATEIEQFLEEYLGRAGRAIPFGGREEQLDRLDRWLARGKHPYTLVAAPAGGGKSALLARWVARVAHDDDHDVAYLPISIRFNTARKRRAMALLGSRLRYVSDRETQRLPADADGWWEEVDAVLKRPAPNPPRQLVIVIDGLDEAAGWSVEDDLTLPMNLGAGVKVLLSARGELSEWLDALKLQDRTEALALERLYPAGIAEALDSIGGLESDDPGGLIDQLARLTAGDPFLLKLYVDELASRGESIRVGVLATLEPGWKAYMRDWWRDQERQWDARSERHPRARDDASELLNLLATAFGPVTGDDIGQLAVGHLSSLDYVKTRLADLRRFVIVRRRERRERYALAHPRFRDYWRDEHMNRQQRETWNQRFLDFGRSALDQVRSGANVGSVSSYAVEHYGAHLDEAGAEDDLVFELVDPNWHRAWEELTGSDGFVDDVGRAWTRAEAAGRRTSDFLTRGAAIGRAVQAALVRASIDTVAAILPPDLLATFAEQGVWTVGAARAAARRAANSGTRPDAIEQLSLRLAGGSYIEDALAIAEEVPDRDARCDLLASIAVELGARGRSSEGLSAVAAIQHPARRMEVLHEISASIEGPLLESALDMWISASWEVRDERLADELLGDLVPVLAVHRPRFVRRTLQRISNAAIRDTAAVAAAQRLTSTAPSEAESLLAEVRDPKEAIRVVLELAPRLTIRARHALLRRLWEQAWTLTEPETRAELVFTLMSADPDLVKADSRFGDVMAVIDALTPRGPVDSRDEVLETIVGGLVAADLLPEAELVARSMVSLESSDRARTAIAAGKARSGALADALMSTHEIISSAQRLRCLSRLASIARRPDAAEEIVHMGLGVVRNASHLDEWLPGMIELALGLDSVWRRELVSDLCAAESHGSARDVLRHLIVERLGHAGLGDEALAAAATITDPSLRDDALAAIAPSLADAGHAQEAIAAAKRIRHLEQREQTLADIARASLWANRVDDGLAALDAIDDETIRRELQVEFGAELALLGRATEVIQALSSVDTDDELSDGIVRIALHLTDPDDIESASTLARSELRGRDLVSPLIALAVAPGASGARSDLLAQALEMSRRVADGKQRAEIRKALAIEMARAGNAEEARRLARRGGDVRNACVTLLRIAREPDISTEEIVREAVGLAERIHDDVVQAAVLESAIHALAGTEATALSLETARAIRDPLRRSHALEAVARATGRHQGPRLLDEALDEVLALAHGPARDVRLWELATVIAPSSPPSAIRALTAIASEDIAEMAAPHAVEPLLAAGAPQAALQAGRMCKEPHSRAGAIARCLPTLPPPLRVDATAELALLADQLPAPLALSLLPALAERIRKGPDLEWAISVAKSVPDNERRCSTLLELATAVPKFAQRLVTAAVVPPEAHAPAAGLVDSALERILSILGVDRTTSLVNRIAEPGARVPLLVRLAWAPDAEAKRATLMAHAVRAAVAGNVDFARIPQLGHEAAPGPELWHLALNAALTITSKETCLRLIATLASYRHDEHRSTAVRAATDQLSRITSARRRSKFATTTIGHLVAAGVDDDAAALLPFITQPDERVRALILLSGVASGKRRHEWLKEAEDLAGKTPGLDQSLACELVEALAVAGLATRGMAITKAITDDNMKHQALIAMAVADPPAGPAEDVLRVADRYIDLRSSRRVVDVSTARVRHGDVNGAARLLIASVFGDPEGGARLTTMVQMTLTRLASEAHHAFLLAFGGEAARRAYLEPEIVALLYAAGRPQIVLDATAGLAPPSRPLAVLLRGLRLVPEELRASTALQLLTMVKAHPAWPRDLMVLRAAQDILLPELVAAGFLDEAAYLAGIETPQVAVVAKLSRALTAAGRSQQALDVADSLVNADDHDHVVLECLSIANREDEDALARAVRTPRRRAEALLGLAQTADHRRRTELVSGALAVTEALDGYLRSSVIAELAKLLVASPPDNAYDLWCIVLRRLVRRSRPDLLVDLARLAPAIRHMGGVAALRVTADALMDIGDWYP